MNGRFKYGFRESVSDGALDMADAVAVPVTADLPHGYARVSRRHVERLFGSRKPAQLRSAYFDGAMAATGDEPILHALRANGLLLAELSLRWAGRAMPKLSDGAVAVSSADDVARLMSDMEGLAQEQLRALLLDNKNGLLDQKVIYQGTVSSAVVRVAEVVRPAVVRCAPFLIVAHNHPSGDPTPSPEDIVVTRRLAQACQLLDIELLDHVVIGRGRYVSMRQRNLGFD